jgi:hypothetical protein
MYNHSLLRLPDLSSFANNQASGPLFYIMPTQKTFWNSLIVINGESCFTQIMSIKNPSPSPTINGVHLGQGITISKNCMTLNQHRWIILLLLLLSQLYHCHVLCWNIKANAVLKLDTMWTHQQVKLFWMVGFQKE